MKLENLLIHGDNIKGLNFLLNEKGLKGKIDLVYIDPPFATGNSFSVTKNKQSTVSKALTGNIAYSDNLTGNDFLNFLKERLLLIKELLSPQGSIYLHIDYKIGHYVKILMDDIFGIDNFKNDITRIKCNPKNFKRKGYGNVKDMILFYTKTAKPIWNEPYIPYTDEEIERLYKKTNNEGRRYTTVPLHAPGETKKGATNDLFKDKLPPEGRHWRTSVANLEEWDRMGLIEWSKKGNPRKIIYADEREGKRLQDIWEFKDPQYTIYPTEKNADLLDLIVRTSSQPKSIVLDCFCGSGTTLNASNNNGRNFIGIDASTLAIKASKKKLIGINYEFLKF